MDDDPLLSWGLKPVELADRPVITPYFASLSQPLSDYTFSQLFTWRNSLRILWTTLRGNLCIFANGSGDLTLLMPPIGDGSPDRALVDAFELMDQYNALHGVPDRSRVEYASEELLARLDLSRFSVQPMGADYVYDVQSMIDLPGGDLASKRQARNRFQRNYEYRVEAYEAALHLEPCRALLDHWKIHQDAQHLEECNSNAIKRQKESIATDLTLQCADQLGMRGLIVSVKDHATGEFAPRAFTFGELLGPDQSSITIEKTDLEIKGLAQFIFSDFCRSCWSERPFVNVGDDWGLETLAWTKRSYRPRKMLQKFLLRVPAPVRVAVSVSVDAGTGDLRSTESNIAESQVAEPAVAIRSACKEDLAPAAELERLCFTAHNLRKRQLQYLQHRPSAVFLVAESDGHLVGHAIALVRQHKKGLSGRIYSLAISPEFRRRKIGQTLLRAMMSEIAARGIKRIYLEVESDNVPATALYERSDFRQIGILPDYFGKGRPGRHMMHEIQEATLFDVEEFRITALR
jgi:ribosomal protein S18 acetylase RimI-like enzyme